MVVAGTNAPVAFFAYPGKPSLLVPEGCELLNLGDAGSDSASTLAALADAMGASESAPVEALVQPDCPSGDLTAQSVGQSLARHMPENALVSDDGVSNGLLSYLPTMTAQPMIG